MIFRILSLLLARHPTIILADHAFVRSFHGLRDFRIVNAQLVQSVSERRAVGDRMQGVDRSDRLARIRRLVGETVVASSSGWMFAASPMIVFCNIDTAVMYCA